jgi:hypothetical protein
MGSAPPAGGLPDPLLPKKVLLRDLGDISEMTFWRLRHHEDPERRFPDPDVRIGGKDLWHQSTAGRYIEAQKRLRRAPSRPRVGTRSPPSAATAEPVALSASAPE